ncbi:MAG: hypothetical protein AB7H97_08820 [Pseudobdellovibrionaceae bacterium]
METTEFKKTLKASKKSTSSAIRVSQETRKRLLSELARINKKPHGKRVKIDALIAALLPKLTAKDVSDLQNASLSGRDRLDQNYRAYCAKFGSVSMDEFLALVSAQAVPQILNQNAANSETEKAAFSERKIEA